LKPGSQSRDPRGDDDEGRDPQHQAFLQSRFDLGKNWEFDSSLRYVDELESFDIDDYLELDLRLSWSPAVNTEVSLVGKNLLESSHREFGTDFVDQPAYEVDRGVFLKISSVF
jgi:iron complex outermembrane receptor protein